MQIAVMFMPPHLHVFSLLYIQWNLAEKKWVLTVVVFSAFSVILFCMACVDKLWHQWD